MALEIVAPQCWGWPKRLATKPSSSFTKESCAPRTNNSPIGQHASRGQITAACELLEKQIETASLWLAPDRPTLAGITLAVVSSFMQHRIPDVVSGREFPNLFAFRDDAEALAVFRQWSLASPQASLAKAPLWS
jgi:glutathione S-transferase